jgi:hypothetical protein
MNKQDDDSWIFWCMVTTEWSASSTAYLEKFAEGYEAWKELDQRFDDGPEDKADDKDKKDDE